MNSNQNSNLSYLIEELGLNEANLSSGLNPDQIKKKREKYGANLLENKAQFRALKLFFKQFKNSIIIILAVGALISIIAGEIINFWVILGVITFVVILGFVQEFSAEKALEELKSIIKPEARVKRAGRIHKILSSEIVPGDIVQIEAGDVVPADGILLSINSFKVNESALTGESQPITKKLNDVVFSGTSVTTGKAEFVVSQIGMSTKFGEIAAAIQTNEGSTPLQKRIDKLSQTLAFIGIAACLLTLGVGLVTEIEFWELLLIALTLAVATVPEGLPLTLTITLTRGVRKLAESNVVVRKLIGVETLGSTTVICTDKTGTLTRNEMQIEKIFFNDNIYNIAGNGYEPIGKIVDQDGNTVDIDQLHSYRIDKFLETGVLANNAVLDRDETGMYKVIGDPTEGALTTFTTKFTNPNNIANAMPRIHEYIFSSERKIMSTLNKNRNGELILHAKGAYEKIIENSNQILIDGVAQPINSKHLYKLKQVHQKFAQSAYRILALAYRPISKEFLNDYDIENNEQEYESQMIFLGFVAMKDPVRQEITRSLEEARSAGIDVKMITGDNALTAKAVATEIGLLNPDPNIATYSNFPTKYREIVKDQIVTGDELEKIADIDLMTIIPNIKVFARIRPDQKLKIVTVLQELGEVVAMTGDGINDAPALKKADIGVAMGITGTRVSQQAATMVLKDDNFASIVGAIKQGRGLYENIEKFIVYLVSQNFNEIILILLTILLLDVRFLPLTALQILYINTFDEAFPSLSLGFSHYRSGLMSEPPRESNQPLLTKRNLALILGSALYMATASFIAFVWADPTNNLETARSLVFLSLTWLVSIIPLSYAQLTPGIAWKNIAKNPLFAIGFFTSTGLAALMIHIPQFAHIMELTRLSFDYWLIAIGIGLGGAIWIEVLKQLSSLIEPMKTIRH